MFTRDFRIYIVLGIYILAAAIFLTGIDYLAGRSIENARIVRLKGYSEAGMESVIREVALLRTDVDLISARVARSAARTYPHLTDIKQLSQTFGLRFERMERISQPSSSPSGPRRYNASVQGDIRKLVRFLRELETAYVVSCEQVILYPVDESGSLVGLSMSILIDETGT